MRTLFILLLIVLCWGCTKNDIGLGYDCYSKTLHHSTSNEMIHSNESFFKNGNLVKFIVDNYITTYVYDENANLIEITESDGNTRTLHEYDEQNRLIKKYQYIEGVHNSTFIYEYSESNLIKTSYRYGVSTEFFFILYYYDNNNDLIKEVTGDDSTLYYLTNRKMDSTVYYRDGQFIRRDYCEYEGGNVIYFETGSKENSVKFIYDGNNNLIKKIVILDNIYSEERSFYDANNMLMGEEIYDENNVLLSRSVYTYENTELVRIDYYNNVGELLDYIIYESTCAAD